MSNAASKPELLALFGGNVIKAAKELEVTRSAIYKAPPELTDSMRRKVAYWYLKNGRKVPRKWLATDKPEPRKYKRSRKLLPRLETL